MIPVLIFIALLVMMVSLLIAPTAINNAMNWRIPEAARPTPSRYPHFPVALIFLLGVGLFYEIGREWPGKAAPSLDLFQFYSGLFGAVFLAAIAVVLCYWPVRAMCFFIPQLRKVSDSAIDPEARKLIVLVAKIFGAILLISSSFFIVHLVKIGV